jgi:hypothetical protein
VTANGGTPAIIPLSLLEALRNLDTPVEDGLEELAGEIVAKRFGLSGTVAAQIQRYQSALQRGLPIPQEETVAVFRLVSRRPDAARGAALPVRAALGAAPGVLRRRIGAGAAARAARRTFTAELAIRGRAAQASIAQPLSLLATADGLACSFYGAALAELLRMLTGFEGAMVHARCRGRGDDACQWRAAAAEGYA